MKTIIAPTDFSASSVNAMNYAADLALAIKAELILLNVVQVPITASEVPLPETVFEDIIKTANQDLDDLGAKLAFRTKGKIQISTEIMIGTVGYQIQEIADRKKPFAIVMGMHHSRATERLLVGSSTLATIKHVHYPVLVVPETVSFTGINKIGIACDLENVVETMPYESLKQILSAFDASVDIIHIEKEENPNPNKIQASVAVQNQLSKFQPKFHFLKYEKLEAGINEFIVENHIDLLIIVPKDRSFMELFNERHSKRIILHQLVPILSVHA